jgi:hypothetical protein
MRVNANVPEREPAVGITRTATFARSAPTAAVTVVAPTDIAVTIPSVFPTVATAGSADDHSNETFVVRPAVSVARAVSCSPSPAASANTER